ncbi:alpha/beta hydrolase [Terribacillus sp. AE2B 122]|uniref:alpha/beta hydrolase n=1 Tax=Terribacillus sp. AE2B 122 TaxID=1331902 RepID=UPI001440C04D|nr:alpha/beta hydrolase [Terribacillus sp. AE2B 122]VVM34639.1 alpha/beta superfamily hydrolase [Terribacillus sp. AE2B 122]
MSLNKIHAEIIGEGKPVLFLPSADFTGNQGQQLADQLEEGYAVHLLDLPGLGQSDGIEKSISVKKLAEWVKSYADAQRLERLSIIGHSLGGLAAISFALHNPEKIDKLILLDAGHKALGTFPVSEFGVLGLVLPFISLVHRFFPAPTNGRLAKLFRSPNDTRELLHRFCETHQTDPNQYIKQMFDNMPTISDAAINLYMLYYRTNLPKLTHELKVSTLLIWADFAGIDEKEAIRSQKAAEAMHNEHVLLKKVSGTHFVQFREDTHQYIAAYLKRNASYA